jgi:Mg2+/Co2+ transporter CorB
MKMSEIEINAIINEAIENLKKIALGSIDDYNDLKSIVTNEDSLEDIDKAIKKSKAEYEDFTKLQEMFNKNMESSYY